jgi:hypothetical protein
MVRAGLFGDVLHPRRTARGAKGHHHWGRPSCADPKRDEHGGHPGDVEASFD